jgi:hypothetical protein
MHPNRFLFKMACRKLLSSFYPQARFGIEKRCQANAGIKQFEGYMVEKQVQFVFCKITAA